MDTIQMAPGEMFDKFTIMVRKVYMGMDAYIPQIKEYQKMFEENKLPAEILLLVCKLQMINTDIWNLESEVRKGKEGRLGFEEVGRRALEIRNMNGERVKIINEMNIIFGDSRRELKNDHASDQSS